MNKYKDKIIITFRFVIIFSFALWIIGGSLYNIIYVEDINNKVNTLKSELLSNELINEYNSSEIYLLKSKAIISKSVSCYFITTDNPKDVLVKFKNYLTLKGWTIKFYNERIYELEATNGKYIFSLGINKDVEISNKNKWVIILANNDFFNKLGM